MITRAASMCFRRINPCFNVERRSNHNHLKGLSMIYRKYSSDIDEQEDSELIVKHDFLVKDLLYVGSNDDIIKQIKASSTTEELSRFIEKIDSLEKNHVCQLILILSQHSKQVGSELELNSIISRFDQLLDQMTIEEISYCYNCLNKLGFNIRRLELMTDKLIAQVTKEDDFPLLYLIHLTAALSSDKGLYSSFIAVSTIPQISKQLAKCSKVEDLNLIVMCLTNISHILSLSLLDDFKTKVEQFLDQDLLNEKYPKIVLRIINFLNYPHWSYKNTALIRRLLLELEENIQFLETKSLVSINRAFHSQLESAKVVPRIVKRAQELLREDPSVELLSLAVLHVTPDQRIKTAEMLRQFLSSYQITSAQSGETLQTVFKILRLLKISDISLCDSYWTKVLNEIYSTKESNIVYRISRSIHKYMFFNNNLGGTYRHIEFEKSLIDMLKSELKKTLVPKDFATFSSFIIAYGDGTGRRMIPQFIVNKIEELNEQFTIKDCMQLSKGVQISQEVRFKGPMTPELQNQIDFINFSLGKSAARHMESNNLHISELNTIIRSFNFRKGKQTYIQFYLCKS